MPGSDSNTIGDYTGAEVAAMDSDTFKAAQMRGFTREAQPVTPDSVAAAYASARSDLQEHVTGRPAAAGVPVGSSVPVRSAQPSATVWASKKAAGEDFVCPSGQTCKLRTLSPESLLTEGILDRVTRLEGLADSLVTTAEGQPPAKPKLPSEEDFKLLLETINLVIPLAVAEPTVYKDDDPDAPADGIRVSDIELTDRMAILEKSLSGVRALDAFRNAR